MENADFQSDHLDFLDNKYEQTRYDSTLTVFLELGLAAITFPVHMYNTSKMAIRISKSKCCSFSACHPILQARIRFEYHRWQLVCAECELFKPGSTITVNNNCGFCLTKFWYDTHTRWLGIEITCARKYLQIHASKCTLINQSTIARNWMNDDFHCSNVYIYTKYSPITNINIQIFLDFVADWPDHVLAQKGCFGQKFCMCLHDTW